MFRPTSVCVMLAMVALQATIARAVLQEESPEMSRREEGDLIRELVERLQESKRNSDSIPDNNYCADVEYCAPDKCWFILPESRHGTVAYRHAELFVQLNSMDERGIVDFKQQFYPYWFPLFSLITIPEPFKYMGRQALVQIHSAKRYTTYFRAEKFCIVEAQCFPKTSCKDRVCHFRPHNKASVDIFVGFEDIRVTVEDENKKTVMSYEDTVLGDKRLAWEETAMTVQKPFQLLGGSYKAVHFLYLESFQSVYTETVCLEVSKP